MTFPRFIHHNNQFQVRYSTSATGLVSPNQKIFISEQYEPGERARSRCEFCSHDKNSVKQGIMAKLGDNI